MYSRSRMGKLHVGCVCTYSWLVLCSVGWIFAPDVLLCSGRSQFSFVVLGWMNVLSLSLYKSFLTRSVFVPAYSLYTPR